MKADFETLADALLARAAAGEDILLSFSGEDTDFVRLNGARVRQPGRVTQRYLRVTLVDGARHASSEMSLSGDIDDDRAEGAAAIGRLRAVLRELPEDPHLHYATSEPSSIDDLDDPGALPETGAMVKTLLEVAGDTDLVGILANGPVYRGFASTRGQRNWFSRRSAHLDFSLFHDADKAVKSGYAATAWDEAAFVATVEKARADLEILERPARRLSPGRYRAYLAPNALREVMELLGWNAFGLKSQRTKQSPLLRLVEGRAALDPRVNLVEDAATGLGARFTDRGFLKPERVDLVREGKLAGALVSARSAKEYGVATNGAETSESWTSLTMTPGTLDTDAVGEALGDGLYISNLWYLNYSDKESCRITGMTRFATLWYEGGVPTGPVDVMRFDESVYRMLGENLEDLGRAPSLLVDGHTYGQRSTRSARLPGALVRDFTFTL